MSSPQIYGDPAGDFGSAVPSTVGSQFYTYLWIKESLVELKKEQYFSQLSGTLAMPKHYGKKVTKYVYIPLLDDANINDQGIDASGLVTTKSISIPVTMSDGSIPDIPFDGKVSGSVVYFEAEGADAAAANDAVIAKVIAWGEGTTEGGGLELTLVGADDDAKFAEMVNSTDGKAYALGFRFDGIEASTDLDARAVVASGNLYGSSKDIGYMTGKFPSLTEEGGMVNRVGFTRREIEGTFQKYGFYTDYTEESMNFDTDPMLERHITREAIFGANEINEDLIQRDLITGAGVVRYAGAATSNATMSGETDAVCEIDFNDLSRLNIDLDNNRCPKRTKIISGSRMVDTKVINSARVLYIGSEMQPTFENMKDPFDNPAFIPLAKYAAAGTELTGEIGSVGYFRIIVVPEMQFWEGAGATESTNAGYRATGGNYDVFPLLVVGSESFTTIGFQTSGKSVKFKIKHSKPGSPESFALDRYGETGFMSIKWYYGMLIERPEWIALLKSVARW
jgi:N4-gp56 family major capsid protein